MVTLVLRAAFWIPLVICTWLALAPEPPQHPVFQVSDVFLHAGAFAYLTFALTLAVSEAPAGTPRRRLYARLACWMLGYGIALELVQGLIPERSAEFKDLAVDLAGIIAGLLLSLLVSDRVRRLARSVERLVIRGNSM